MRFVRGRKNGSLLISSLGRYQMRLVIKGEFRQPDNPSLSIITTIISSTHDLTAHGDKYTTLTPFLHPSIYQKYTLQVGTPSKHHDDQQTKHQSRHRTQQTQRTTIRLPSKRRPPNLNGRTGQRQRNSAIPNVQNARRSQADRGPGDHNARTTGRDGSPVDGERGRVCREDMPRYRKHGR